MYAFDAFHLWRGVCKRIFPSGVVISQGPDSLRIFPTCLHNVAKMVLRRFDFLLRVWCAFSVLGVATYLGEVHHIAIQNNGIRLYV